MDKSNCTNRNSTCEIEKYAELSWDHLENSALKNQSIYDFWTNTWTPTVMKAFPNLNETAFKNVVTSADEHDTDGLTRMNFKYGATNGVHGTPSAFVNGVRIDVPESIDAWDTYLKSLLSKNANQQSDL